MSASEIKFEIQKSLDRVPENILQDILNFLKQAENQSAHIKSLQDIINEDKELLEKLAKWEYNLDIKSTNDNNYEFVINAAQGLLTFQEIKYWITKNLI